MFKVLLLSPYLTINENRWVQPNEPLGLLYLATYVRREAEKQSLDIDIRIFDAHIEGSGTCLKTERGYRSGVGNAALQKTIRDYGPDIVGLTNSFTTHLADTLEISKLVKDACPDSLLAIGGAHATLDHQRLASCPEVDVVIRGEGEVTFWEMLLCLFEKRGLEDIAGITLGTSPEVRVNPDRPLIQDLDSLPIPDRSLIPYEKYLSSEIFGFQTMRKPIGTVFSSRGCPFRCVFCSTQKVWTNKWRARSPRNVVSEIEYLHTTYGVNEIFFEDDQFAGDKKRIIELCGLIVQRNLKMSFMVPPGISPSLIDEEVLDHMRRAGFYRISYSIDVGTDRSKAFVGKPVKLSELRALVKKTNKMGFWTNASFVIGFPHETEADILETVRFAFSLHLDTIMFYIAQPHLGSKLYDIFLEKGLIDETTGEAYHAITDSHIGTEHLSAQKLKDLRNDAEKQYLKAYVRRMFNPLYFLGEFLPKISSPKKLLYFLRLLLLQLKIQTR